MCSNFQAQIKKPAKSSGTADVVFPGPDEGERLLASVYLCALHGALGLGL